jgi:hypothetical protein
MVHLGNNSDFLWYGVIAQLDLSCICRHCSICTLVYICVTGDLFPHGHCGMVRQGLFMTTLMGLNGFSDCVSLLPPLLVIVMLGAQRYRVRPVSKHSRQELLTDPR